MQITTSDTKNTVASIRPNLSISKSQALPLPFPLENLDLESFIKFTLDPFDTQAVINMQKMLVTSPRRPEMIKHVEAIIAADKEFVQLYNVKYFPQFPTTAQLSAYPEGTFGKVVANHLILNGIELDFAGIDISVFLKQEMTLIGYLGIRGIRTHDLYHAVLGIGTTPIDEYTLTSFTLAQFASPYHMMIVASGYLHTAFHTPELIPHFLAETNRFYQLGKKAKSFIGFKFEEHFGTPIDELRKTLNLQ